MAMRISSDNFIRESAGGRRDAVPSPVTSLVGRSIMRVADLTPTEVLALFEYVHAIETGAVTTTGLLHGQVVCTLFFEPSTRTRLSFESAVLRAGGNVLSVSDGYATGVQKGESLSDIRIMIDGYADACVIRHPDAAALAAFDSVKVSSPMINAGIGQREHPTQALIDWYTLWSEGVVATGRRICVVGVPARMRSIRSFLLLGCRVFPSALHGLAVVSQYEDWCDPELADALQSAGVDVERTTNLDEVAAASGVIYLNALTMLDGRFVSLTGDTVLSVDSPLSSTCRILHPLARGPELDRSLDSTPHNLYFRQARVGVPLRQGLLSSILGGTNA